MKFKGIRRSFLRPFGVKDSGHPRRALNFPIFAGFLSGEKLR